MNKMWRYVSVFAVLAFLAFPTLADKGGCLAPLEVVMGGSMSGLQDPLELVIENEADWCVFWDEVHRYLSPMPPCDFRGIDFSKETAIVVAVGTRPSGCYGVEIWCVHRGHKTENVLVRYREWVPEVGCPCLPVVTYPYTVVKVEKPVERVHFQGREETMVCP